MPKSERLKRKWSGAPEVLRLQALDEVVQIQPQSIVENWNTKITREHILNIKVNPFKPSGAKWLHYKVFKAILV